MPVRQFQLALLLMAVLLGGLWFWLHRMDQPVDEPRPAQAAPESVADPVAAPDMARSYTEGASAHSLPDLPEGSIPGEFTVQLPDPGALEVFLEAAEARGLRILGVIDELGMVRLAGPREVLEEILGPDVSFENNFRMEAPPAPDPDFWESDSLHPVMSRVLQFLGVPPGTDLSGWGQGITVAVLDSGWLDHPGIPAAQVRQLDLLDSAMNGTFAGHGTAVAGLVASLSETAPGLAPGSDILSIRVLDAEGQGNSFTLARGIVAAVENGADVINMSLGGYGDSQVLRAAVQYATDRGVVLVASAGNDGAGQLTYPAGYPGVIAVGAVDALGNRAPFSNYGAALDLVAPGFRVSALWGDGGYILMDGTSAAAPLVSAAAARLLQEDPNLGPDGVMEVLLSQANDKGLPGVDVQYGAGVLSMDRLENRETPGIYDVALADLYPALEEADGATVPLYVTVQNRGTELLAQANVTVTVNGTDFYYRLSGLSPGAVDSILLPVVPQNLAGGQQLTVQAVVRLPSGDEDSRPLNNAGRISLRLGGED